MECDNKSMTNKYYFETIAKNQIGEINKMENRKGCDLSKRES